ncbi:MAG: ABC transporter substrate-binding protein [Proteobacteria bacterium]|nr:ABC transporter substrate-binding protein [Pseudomonadota bacterium]
MRFKGLSIIFLLAVFAIIIGACVAPAAQPQVVKETVVVEKEVFVEVTPDSSGAEESMEPQSGGTLNLSLGPDFITFHPYFDVSTGQFKPIFFEAPIRISDEGDFEPWLAESWEESEDGMSITLNLREGVMFHNGREMAADDVVWSVEHAMSTEFGHHLSDRFQTATGAEKIDDYTVKINYSKPGPKLDGIATMQIFPQEALENIEIMPVGTGPFIFEEWVPGDKLVGTRFEDYWQEGLPYLDEVIIKPIPDEQSRMVNLMAGSIDALRGVPLADKELLETAPGIVVSSSPAGFFFYAFIMNINEPPFNNPLVRQAMNYAVDRDKIAQTAFHGAEVPVLEPYPETSWAYREDLADLYTYDPEKAKELLAEAGYPDGFTTSMLIRGPSGPYLDQAQVYQQDLAAIGIDMELLPTELAQYFPALIGSEFAIASHGTGDATVDASGLFEGAACCRPFRNFFGITDNDTWFPEYAELIEKGSASLDRDERKQYYGDALAIQMEQGWNIPTAWRQEIYAHSDKVHDFRTDMAGNIWLNETWMSE